MLRSTEYDYDVVLVEEIVLVSGNVLKKNGVLSIQISKQAPHGAAKC